jgi:5-methylcytosine-specific restriction endonuclease McrA
MRAVPEWIGKHDDQAVPPRVRLRVFERYEGRCYLSGRKIMPGDAWDLEHIKSLSLGGEHRESNFAPALKAPHKVKSAQERSLQAKSDRIRKRHLGIKPRKGRPMPGARGSGIRKPMGGPAYRDPNW